MKRNPAIAMVAAIAISLSALAVETAAAEDYANAHLIIGAETLHASLNQPDLRIVDVRPAEDYAAGHIPGAIRIDPDAVVDPLSPIEGALLPTADLVRLFGELGLSSDQEIVLYDDQSGFQAARLFWLLEYYGHRNVRLLNGGLAAWNGQLVSDDVTPVPAASYAAAVSPRRYASADWIMERRDDANTVVIDVRPGEAFNKGHIPWAKNIPWKGNLAPDGTMKSAEDLKAHFAEHGVTEDMNVVVHCQTGRASSHSYFALRLIGFPQVRTYHRSWAEWGSSDDLPKAVGEQG